MAGGRDNLADAAAPTSERPGWRRAIAGFALIFVLYQLAEGLQTEFAPESPLGPALMLAACLACWPVGRSLGGFGLGWNRRTAGLLAGGLLLAGLARLAAVALGLASGGYVSADEVLILAPATVGIAAATTFVPSLTEDILTRGFLFRYFPERLGGVAFILASAALYVANHLWRYDWGITEQLRLLALGLAYGAATWRWRSLWGAVALHWGWNLSSALSDAVLPVALANELFVRAASGGVHLVLLAIVLLLPGARQGARAQPLSLPARSASDRS